MEHAIEIIPWFDFLSGNTSQSWKDKENRIDLSTDTPEIKQRVKSERNGAVFVIANKTDLEELSSLILSKFIILRVTLIHTQVGSKYASDSVSIWEGDYAVIINTKSNKVKKQFEKVFTDAGVNIDTGWKYSVEVDLSDIVEAWYVQHNEVLSGCDDFQTTKTKNCRIILTNFTPYLHCFDCSPRWWLLFGPCWLLSAPCYFLHRTLTCRDTKYSLIDCSPRWWLLFGPCWLLSAPFYFLHRNLTCRDTKYSLIDCSPRWWLLFGPCWLLSAPCYFLHRTLTCRDTKYSLIADTSPYKGYGHTLGSRGSRHSIHTMVSYKSSGDVTTMITENASDYGTI